MQKYENEIENVDKKNNNKKLAIVIGVIVLVSVLVAGYFMFVKNTTKDENSSKNNKITTSEKKKSTKDNSKSENSKKNDDSKENNNEKKSSVSEQKSEAKIEQKIGAVSEDEILNAGGIFFAIGDDGKEYIESAGYPVKLTWDEYNGMEDMYKQKYEASFPSPEEFSDWQTRAQAGEYPPNCK